MSDTASAGGGVTSPTSPKVAGDTPKRKTSNVQQMKKQETAEGKRADLLKMLDESVLAAVNQSNVAGLTEAELKLGELDITSDDYDFEEFEGDMKVFEQDELARKAIEQEIDIREYSKSVEEDLRQIEIASIDDYLQESERLATLHQQLQQCDGVLEKMESMLQKFQASLGNISEEIKVLQERSFSMNIKLKNRQNAEKELAYFIDQVVLPPSLITNVCESDVNEMYLDYLITLNQKTDFIQSLTEQQNVRGNVSVSKPVAILDVEPSLQKLCQKAAIKVKAFLLQKINELKKPKTNTQFVKQNILLKYKFFQEFLEKHNPEGANEVKMTYVDTISKYYLQSFKNYVSALQKLENKITTKSDVIVEAAQSSGFSLNIFGGSPAQSRVNKRSVFLLGERSKVLENLHDVNQVPIVAHVALEKKEVYLYESLFRSMHILLLNTATAEYIFLLEFFPQPLPDYIPITEDTPKTPESPKPEASPKPSATTTRPTTTTTTTTTSSAQADKSRQEEDPHIEYIKKLFNLIFKKSLVLIIQAVEAYLGSTYDSVGVLLLIQMTQFFRDMMNKRRVTALDSYFDELLLKLWPKFKSIFDLNLQSITSASASSLVQKERTSFSVSKRYAEYAAAIAILNREGPYKNMLDTNMASLEQAVEKLIIQMAEKLSTSSTATPQSTKQQCIFLINCYDTVLNTFVTHGVETKEGDRIMNLLKQQISTYVELELQECYSKLITYVQQTEPLVSQSQNPTTNRNRANTVEMETIAKDFEKNWKAGIAHVNSNVTRNFSNPKTANAILKQCLSQLVLYYTRFSQVVFACYPNPQFKLVGNQNILVEIRQYYKENM